ncbi:hypothetical protein [Cyanobium sp. Cruz-8D1]|uniref:hypothetical protein n=2 Tax=unclassified Cyanobium TaxID=2627006 RepID=UPI0020CFDD6D|nr:hypothetical protein [Cyanobium sp. Cruz-8D1]
MAGPQMTGMAAQGPLPAGMLRIRLGSQERYVWPVHLPGWLGLGWRVAGAEATAVAQADGVAVAELPAPIAAPAGELLEQDDAKPASTRGRRGRRRKDEALPVEPADTGAGTVSDNSDSDASGKELSKQEQDAEPPAAGGSEPDPDPDLAVDPSPDAELALTALPDDLFDDPLI